MAVSTILFIILSGIIALGTALFFYFYKPERSKKLRFLLSALRFITLFSVLLLLINPVFKQVTYTTVKPKLAVAVDNSNSIAFLNASENVLSAVNNLKNNKALNDRFELDFYSFGSEITHLDSITFNEEQTNIHKALKSLSTIYKKEHYIPLLITDGNANLGANYRYTYVDLNKEPVYFIAVGDTTRYEDLSVDRINVNKYAYLENEFPVEITTSYTGTNAVNTTVSVIKNGTVVYKEDKSFSASQNSQRLTVYLKASGIGVQKYTVSLSVLSEEKNTENNSKNFAVEVIDQRSKVLLVYSILHPDLGTLKKSIESNQLRSVEIKEVNTVSTAELNDADLIILFEPDSNFKKVYSELDKLNKNRFTIAGSAVDRSFLNSIQKTISLPINNQTEEVQAAVNKSFSAFQINNLDFSGFPPLQTLFGTFKISGAGDVILNQRIAGLETQNPLLGITEFDGRREVFLLGTGIYQWRSQSYLNTSSFEEFDNFIDKLVQFAASNEKRERLTINFERFYYGGSSTKITAQFFDQNYVFDPAANLQISLQNTETGTLYEAPFVSKGNEYEVLVSGLEAGDYTFSVKEVSSGIIKTGDFTIIPYNLERQNLNADFSKMKAVATETNGQIRTLNKINELIDLLVNDNRFIPVQRAVVKSVPLIHFLYLLALIIASLTTEWFIRKYNGLI